MPLPVMGPLLVSLRSRRRGGLGVSTWLADEEMVLESTSLSSGMGPWPDGARDVGLLTPLTPATGRPKKELRGEMMPGDVGFGEVVLGVRNMLFAAPAAPTSDVERRCV